MANETIGSIENIVCCVDGMFTQIVIVLLDGRVGYKRLTRSAFNEY